MHQVGAAPLQQQVLPQNMAEAVASQPAAVAVKKEYDADTDDDEAASAAGKNSASDVAPMVAVKKEYDADNDSDEENQSPIKKAKRDANEHAKEYEADIDNEVELSVAGEIIASEVASSMVAVKTEHNADTNSDEEQHQQSNKKAKRDDKEHEKHIAEIRKITDPLLSLGRQHPPDATVLKQIRQIAHDVESFSNELKKSADDAEERQRKIEQGLTLIVHASTCTQESFCNSVNCAKMKGYLKHGKTCKVKAPGGCKLCKRVYTLLRIHAISKQCKQENCPVQHCMAIRKRYRQIRSQQQAG